MKGSAKLTNDERRGMVLSALAGKNRKELAEEHGIARSWLYVLVDEALEDPQGKLEEAEAEAAYRREVLKLADTKAASE